LDVAHNELGFLRKTSAEGRVFPFAKAQKNGFFAMLKIECILYKTMG
jgi:hypothetical protein